jgi:hypothetical protein
MTVLISKSPKRTFSLTISGRPSILTLPDDAAQTSVISPLFIPFTPVYQMFMKVSSLFFTVPYIPVDYFVTHTFFAFDPGSSGNLFRT